MEFGGTLGEHGERAEQHQQVDEEHHEVAGREAAFEHAPAAVEQEQHAGERHDDFPDDFDGPHPPPGVQLLPAHEMVAAHDAARFGALPAEGADDAHAAERLGGLGVDFFALGANAAMLRPDAADPRAMRDINERDEGGRAGSSLQSTHARMQKLPTSWMIARHGL